MAFILDDRTGQCGCKNSSNKFYKNDACEDSFLKDCHSCYEEYCLHYDQVFNVFKISKQIPPCVIFSYYIDDRIKSLI